MQLSCCKYPKSFFLVEEWENNKESLLSYLEQVHMGVKGLVSREGNTLQPGAEIIVWNPDGSRRAKSVLTSQDGEYWRLLLPNVAGNNTFTVQVSGEYWLMMMLLYSFQILRRAGRIVTQGAPAEFTSRSNTESSSQRTVHSKFRT